MFTYRCLTPSFLGVGEIHHLISHHHLCSRLRFRHFLFYSNPFRICFSRCSVICNPFICSLQSKETRKYCRYYLLPCYYWLFFNLYVHTYIHTMYPYFCFGKDVDLFQLPIAWHHQIAGLLAKWCLVTMSIGLWMWMDPCCLFSHDVMVLIYCQFCNISIYISDRATTAPIHVKQSLL